MESLGRVNPEDDGIVDMTTLRERCDAISLASSEGITWPPNSFARVSAFSLVRL